jgi:tyrosine-protein kinase Etk/Wzc
MPQTPTIREDPSGVATSEERAPEEEHPGMTFLDVLILLAKHKKIVFGLPLAAAVIGAGISLLLTNIYTATTKLLPPQQSQSAATAMLAQLGNAAALVGGAAGIKNPNDLYLAMLKSRTVADNLIERFDLNKRFEQTYQSSTRSTLAAKANIVSGKDGIITIEVEDKDPDFAAELANGYADELLKFTQVLAVTEASARRLFFERQLTQARDNLAKAENRARQALQQGGLVKVDEQGRAIIETTARLRAQMSVKEIQIGAMRTFATESNPELRIAQQELESMKHELAKMEGTGSIKAVGNAVDGKGIDNLSLLRNLKYNEALYELLAKQYEIAKIDEAKDSAVVQVMDKAIIPDQRSKPKRRQIVQFSALAAFLAAILWVLGREAIASSLREPQRAARLQTLKRYLSWR